MKLPLFQVDAFASRVFAGNPAAVVPLKTWLPDEQLLAIAAENNLSETAYLVGKAGDYEIRWFTPTAEVDLCGHATLASGWVVCRKLEPRRKKVRFRTRQAGDLEVERAGEDYVLDFPSRPPKPVPTPREIPPAVGAAPKEVLFAKKLLAVFDDPEFVRAMKPDFSLIKRLDADGLIVTAPGKDCDFVSRYFVPQFGIDEDPVTGSAHCLLTPYWAQRLGKTKLRARQVSARGGELACELRGDRVRLAGRAMPYLEGTITI